MLYWKPGKVLRIRSSGSGSENLKNLLDVFLFFLNQNFIIIIISMKKLLNNIYIIIFLK